VVPSKDKFEQTVREIINSSHYQHLKNNLINFITNLKDLILKWLYRKIDGLNWHLHPSVTDNASTFFIIVGVLILIGFVVLVIVLFSRKVENPTPIKEILGERIERTSTPYTYRKKAEEFEEKGEFRMSIRYGFIGLLLLMHERYLLYLNKASTNLEISAQLKKNDFSRQRELEKAVDIYNSIWYGHKDCGEGLYQSWGINWNLLWDEVEKYEKI
jgi:hypothetical protein